MRQILAASDRMPPDFGYEECDISNRNPPPTWSWVVVAIPIRACQDSVERHGLAEDHQRYLLGAEHQRLGYCFSTNGNIEALRFHCFAE